MSTATKGKKPAGGAQNGAKRGRSAGKAEGRTLDAAETLGASNSLEKMGAHQFAAAHGMAMKLMHDGAEMLRKVGNGDTKSGSTLDALAL